MPKGIPNKRYTAQFKQEVIETMQGEGLSYEETSRRFGVVRSWVTAWERIYLEEGAEGFLIERRGRVQRLRAENAYLKKLQALVLEDEQRQGRRPWRSKN